MDIDGDDVDNGWDGEVLNVLSTLVLNVGKSEPMRNQVNEMDKGEKSFTNRGTTTNFTIEVE